MQGTTTVLLDGAALGCLDRVLCGRRGTYGIGGLLMFGTPEHPLTRDLCFEGTLFNYEDVTADAAPGQRTSGGEFRAGRDGQEESSAARTPRQARVI